MKNQLKLIPFGLILMALFITACFSNLPSPACDSRMFLVAQDPGGDQDDETLYKTKEDTLEKEGNFLRKDTRIRCGGPTGPTVMFAKGTPVKLVDNRYLSEGTLKNNTKLRAGGKSGFNPIFRGGTQIRFNNGGFVTMGTLNNDKQLRYASATGHYKLFRAGTVLQFNNDGSAQE